MGLANFHALHLSFPSAGDSCPRGSVGDWREVHQSHSKKCQRQPVPVKSSKWRFSGRITVGMALDRLGRLLVSTILQPSAAPTNRLPSASRSRSPRRISRRHDALDRDDGLGVPQVRYLVYTCPPALGAARTRCAAHGAWGRQDCRHLSRGCRGCAVHGGTILADVLGRRSHVPPELPPLSPSHDRRHAERVLQRSNRIVAATCAVLVWPARPPPRGGGRTFSASAARSTACPAAGGVSRAAVCASAA